MKFQADGRRVVRRPEKPVHQVIRQRIRQELVTDISPCFNGVVYSFTFSDGKSFRADKKVRRFWSHRQIPNNADLPAVHAGQPISSGRSSD
jgi:hypothetical protein